MKSTRGVAHFCTLLTKSAHPLKLSWRVGLALLSAVVVAPVALAVAQPITVPAPATKKIEIYNNSTVRIFPMLEIGRKRLDANTVNADLWMQAVLGISTSDTYTREFPTTLNYRAYINPPTATSPGGIPPRGSVVVTLPFYTQLKDVTEANLGIDNDQFIDWWNGARLYLFQGAVAANSAAVTYETTAGPPQDVNPLATAAPVTCTDSPRNPRPHCDVVLKSITIDSLFNIPFQLQEFTLGSAEGPPPGGLLPAGSPLTMQMEWVNYNVSSLDSVYMPIAMGPVGDTTVPFVGSVQSLPNFSKELLSFARSGAGWPFYVPTYFTTATNTGFPVIYGAACSLAPITSISPPQTTYPGVKIPGTANVIALSYQGVPSASGGNVINPPIPPTLSSQPANYRTFPGYSEDNCVSAGIDPYDTPALGTNGQAVVNLWRHCTETGTDTSVTCTQIRLVQELFISNYQAKCGTDPKNQPDVVSTLFAVYGWVPIRYPLYAAQACQGGALAGSNPGNPLPIYIAAQEAYCHLQYNYLTLPAGDTADIFNPYVKLVHSTLGSSAYAYSIDDKLSFKRVVADGVIIAIGGSNGLENSTPTNPPDKETLDSYCQFSN